MVKLTGPNWFDISFVMYFEVSKEDIIKIAEDVVDIINNTESFRDSKGELIGFINKYLNINMPQCIEGELHEFNNKNVGRINNKKD